MQFFSNVLVCVTLYMICACECSVHREQNKLSLLRHLMYVLIMVLRTSER